MKKLRILIVAVLLPFALYGAKKQDLPYNYIDNSAPKITKELVEQREKKELEERLHRLQNIEESGGFIGVGAGYGGATYKENGNLFIPVTVTTKNCKNALHCQYKYFPCILCSNPSKVNIPTITVTYIQTIPYDFDTNGGFVSINIISGYKYFVAQYGFRIYANLDYQPKATKNNEQDDKINLINYGANADFLFNFVNSKSINFGGFVGLGLGGNTFVGSFVDDLEKYVKAINEALNKNEIFHRTGFDMWLNAGLRINLYKHFGLEITAKVPFMKTFFVESDDFTATIKRDYATTISVLYNF